MTTRSAETPAVAVCAGSDCAKDERKRWRALVTELEDLDVVRTKCLGLCEGPVAVLAPESEKPVVVEGIKRKHAATVADHARRGTRPGKDAGLKVVTKKKRRAKAIEKARSGVAA